MKRGTVTIDIDKVTLNAEKNSAVITSKASKLTTGEYTVKFKDREPLAFAVEEGKVAKIDIPSDTLPMLGDYNTSTTAAVTYAVYNQFDEDITKVTSSINATTSFGTATATSNTSTITVEFPGSSKPLIGATGTIILVDTATGVNFSKTLTLGMPAKADTIEVLGVYNSVSAEKMEIKENSTNENAALLVKVSDQYGGPMNKLDCDKEVAFTFTGGLTNLDVQLGNKIFKETISVDGTLYVVIPLTAQTGKVVKAGTAQAFFVSTSTGKTANATITVGANATVKTIDVYPMDSVYAGKVNEFGFTALTEDGSEVKDYDTLSNTQYGIATMPSPTTLGEFKWLKNSDGSAKLVFDSKAHLDTKSTICSATFVTAGYGTKTLTFTLLQESKPTSIGGTKDVTLGVLGDVAGASNEAVKFNPSSNLVIYDQHGNSMAKEDFNGQAVKIELANPSSSTGRFELQKADGSTGSSIVLALNGSASVTFAAINGIDKLYTEQYKVSLFGTEADANNNQNVVDASYTMSVSAAPMSALSRFTMKKIDDLYAFELVDSNKAPIAENQKYVDSHKTAPEVTGYVGNIAIAVPNRKLTLTPGRGVNVVSKGGVEYFVASGAASYITNNGTEPNTTSRATNVTVTVDNTAGTKLTQELNVSRVAPRATVVIAKDSVEVTAAVAMNMNNLLGSLTKMVFDQYGKFWPDAAYPGSISTGDVSNIQISNITDADNNGFVVSKNNTNSAVITSASAGDSFVITVTLKSGTVVTCVVEIVNPS